MIGPYIYKLQSVCWYGFFAYDQINYLRHYSYNWTTQQQLHLTHPAIYHKFIKGHFSVKRARGNFNKLPPDQVIEQTINNEQKGSGGIIKTSTFGGAVQRWILSSHIIAGRLTNFKESVNLATRKNVPKDLGKTRIKNDEKVVQHCCSIIKSWQNLFEHSEKIVGLSSQIEAPPAVQATIRESSFKDFIQNRIESNNFGFYEPINKLRNFDASIMTKIMKVHWKDIAIKTDRET